MKQELAKRSDHQTPQAASPLRRGGGRAATSAATRWITIDYKDFQSLRRYLSDKGKIRSRRITGACRRHQNQLANAVKRARELALLPYVSER